jgi:NAD(P)-dependent dehydrogenase (short-subunit alcohol dehydrogenase family)
VAVKLSQRVYIVTGAAGGIGRGIATALLEDGASVVLTDLEPESTRRVAASLDPTGDRTHCVAADLAVPGDIERLVEEAVAHFGRLDGLVNNAGVIVLDAAWDASLSDWTRQLDVNVVASFATARAVARRLRGSGGGSIVNVASNCGKVGYDNMAAYNASKAAVISLTRSLSREWAADGINVNAVCPGGVDTAMLAGVAEWLQPRLGIDAAELLAGMGAAQLGRKIQPVEVGRVVSFLLGPDATIIRGQAINVDGGDTPY